MPTDDVVHTTEDMINEWCAAYDAGKIPTGYEMAEPVVHGKPHILDEGIARDDQIDTQADRGK